MLNKFSRFTFPILICILLLTGCWDAKDISTYDIITTVGNDYDNGEYKFTSEITNLKKASDSQKSRIQISYNNSSGKTLSGTRDELNRKNDNMSFLGATRVIIFSVRLAELGITEYMNRIRGIHDYRKNTLVAVSSSDIKALMKTETENSISTGFEMEGNYENLLELGSTFKVNAGLVLEELAVGKAGFLLPQYDIVKDDNTMVGYSIISNGKRIGFLPATLRRGAVFLLADKPTAIYEVKVNGGKFIVLATLNNLKITPKMNGDKLSFIVDIKMGAEIQYNLAISHAYPYIMKELESTLGDMVKQDIVDTINRSQKDFKCDYLRFYKYFRIKYPDEFKASDWNAKYSDATFEIKVKSKITNTGMNDYNPITRWPY